MNVINMGQVRRKGTAMLIERLLSTEPSLKAVRPRGTMHQFALHHNVACFGSIFSSRYHDLNGRRYDGSLSIANESPSLRF